MNHGWILAHIQYLVVIEKLTTLWVQGNSPVRSLVLCRKPAKPGELFALGAYRATELYGGSGSCRSPYLNKEGSGTSSYYYTLFQQPSETVLVTWQRLPGLRAHVGKGIK